MEGSVSVGSILEKFGGSKADRVAAQREAAFQKHLSNREAYNAVIIAAGNTPRRMWHDDDIERQRDLFMRRYDQ